MNELLKANISLVLLLLFSISVPSFGQENSYQCLSLESVSFTKALCVPSKKAVCHSGQPNNCEVGDKKTSCYYAEEMGSFIDFKTSRQVGDNCTAYGKQICDDSGEIGTCTPGPCIKYSPPECETKCNTCYKNVKTVETSPTGCNLFCIDSPCEDEEPICPGSMCRDEYGNPRECPGGYTQSCDATYTENGKTFFYVPEKLACGSDKVCPETTPLRGLGMIVPNSDDIIDSIDPLYRNLYDGVRGKNICDVADLGFRENLLSVLCPSCVFTDVTQCIIRMSLRGPSTCAPPPSPPTPPIKKTKQCPWIQPEDRKPGPDGKCWNGRDPTPRGCCDVRTGNRFPQDCCECNNNAPNCNSDCKIPASKCNG